MRKQRSSRICVALLAGRDAARGLSLLSYPYRKLTKEMIMTRLSTILILSTAAAGLMATPSFAQSYGSGSNYGNTAPQRAQTPRKVDNTSSATRELERRAKALRKKEAMEAELAMKEKEAMMKEKEAMMKDDGKRCHDGKRAHDGQREDDGQRENDERRRTFRSAN